MQLRRFYRRQTPTPAPRFPVRLTLEHPHDWVSRPARKLLGAEPPTCAYCQRTAQQVGRPLTVDHVVPLSRGGTGPDNQVLACPNCNQRKGSMSAETFRFRYGFTE